MKNKIRLIILAFLLTVSTIPDGTAQASDNNLIIATATTGGTYYPVGVAISTLISIKLSGFHNLTATAINSAGSAENLQMLKYKECDMAILQALFGLNAFDGTGPYDGKPIKDFSSVTMLWEDVAHFVVLKEDVKTGTVMDLHNLGKNFSIGPPGSGAEFSGRTILSALGINPEKEMALEFLGYAPAVNAFLTGDLSGFSVSAGTPADAITELYAQPGIKRFQILEVSDSELALIRQKHGIWNRFVLKAGTYPGQDADINTISEPNFLACRTDLPEKTVYLITKTIFENLPFLYNIHKATRSMSLERGMIGLPVPLHPGAEKYFKEKGLLP